MDLFSELECIFHPRGVAIVGASNKPGNLGSFYLGGFLQQGFDNNRLYVVHPTETEVRGIKVYPSVKDIPYEVDLALVFSPRDAVVGVVKDCTVKGVKGAVVCTSGFAESGAEGLRKQQELVAAARAGDTRIIGPNCVGIYCPESKLINFPGRMSDISGPVGMISHSGSMTVSIPGIAASMGMYFSKAISCGNECDLNAADFMEYFGRDPNTRMIIAYLEGVIEGRRLFEVARRVSKEKPILLWKGGITEVGRHSAASHTGALAGKAEVWDALYKQTGMVKVECEDDMVDYLQAFHYLPRLHGNRVAIVSATGGVGVGIADACVQYGLEVVRLSDKTRRSIQAFVPSVGTCLDNPIDLGMMSSFSLQASVETVKALAEDDSVDVVIKTIGTSDMDMIRKEFEALAGFDKPMVYIFSRALKLKMEVPNPVKGVCVFSTGRRAAQVLSKMIEYERYRSGQ